MPSWINHKLDCQEKYQQSHICRWYHPYGRKWRGTKEPLDKSERGQWKSWLKAQHSENEDHGIGPITSWEIDGETVETVSNFIFLGSKITTDGDCSHEIKRHLLLGREVKTNLDSIFKSRDINLPTKVCLVKAMVFPMVIYGCESWTVKKAEHWRIDAFELRCWRRLLRVSWTARRSNQSILKEISLGISLEGMMLKLKLQYFGQLMRELTHWKRVWCYFHCFPIYFPWSDGTNAMILVFWMLSFKPTYSSPLSLSSRGFWVPLHLLP